MNWVFISQKTPFFIVAVKTSNLTIPDIISPMLHRVVPGMGTNTRRLWKEEKMWAERRRYWRI
jgi:hypothetical protein